ncbi:DUF1801 domain-containing protein [Maricaulis parjimensis]|uniref:DUF1801 domain-containing protein n=1 Tax=Maricaulis parjimensis TaxID=144023 RepID=UPI00193AB141|nr:DUF1801 domain-containing protein [Maricaulis parjimensis]
MGQAENKTQPTQVSPADHVASIEHPVRRSDAETLLDMMSRITGWEARMWGPSIVGFGEYHYKYDSGREGDFMRTGFSARKANLVVYIMPGYTDFSSILARLGKHKLGKSCLYINKLADVDLDVLEELIRAGLADMAEKYPDGA